MRERIKHSNPDMPVIIITSEDEELSELIGLEKGADDYITKPIRPRALIARIRAVLRRSRNILMQGEGSTPPPPMQSPNVIEVSTIKIDPDAYSCEVDGTAVDLTGSEFALLQCLMEHPNWTHPRERLAERIYLDEQPANLRAVDYIASPLRKKLKPHLNGINAIVAKSGVGYRINPTLLEPGK